MTDDLLPEYDYSPETLMHYRHRGCPGNGDNGWSINSGRSNQDYYCPYCGQRLSPAQYEPVTATFTSSVQEIDL